MVSHLAETGKPILSLHLRSPFAHVPILPSIRISASPRHPPQAAPVAAASVTTDPPPANPSPRTSIRPRPSKLDVFGTSSVPEPDPAKLCSMFAAGGSPQEFHFVCEANYTPGFYIRGCRYFTMGQYGAWFFSCSYRRCSSVKITTIPINVPIALYTRGSNRS